MPPCHSDGKIFGVFGYDRASRAINLSLCLYESQVSAKEESQALWRIRQTPKVTVGSTGTAGEESAKASGDTVRPDKSGASR